jgi:hypothetical protein
MNQFDTQQSSTFTPDLIQRELNSRFLQTSSNNYTDKNNKIGTTTTNPYLNINQNEFPPKSLFNPMVNIISLSLSLSLSHSLSIL